MTAALVITLGLGYVRFVHRGAAAVLAAPAITRSDRTAIVRARCPYSMNIIPPPLPPKRGLTTLLKIDPKVYDTPKFTK
jgi:hypothetical protein